MFTTIWEFRVAPEQRAAFESCYGPQGDWAQLFARSAQFRGTILLRDPSVPGRYMTIDNWEDEDGFARFQERFAAEYKSLDARSERLTEYEVRIGHFEAVVDRES